MKNRDNTLSHGHVEVITWGTKFNGGNGLSEQIRTMFDGGNTGHAALRLTIPIDADGKANNLIEQYCYHNNQIILPHIKKKLPDGTEVFEVYISAWQAEGESRDDVSFNTNFNKDSVLKHRDVHFNWDPRWEAEFKPEKRVSRGIVGSTTMQLGPQGIIHQRDLTDEQFADLGVIQKYRLYLNELDNFTRLHNKLHYINQHGQKIGDTEKIWLDRLLPRWRTELGGQPITGLTTLIYLAKMVMNAKDEYAANPDNQKTKNDIRALAKRELTELQDRIREDVEKVGSITPETARDIVEKRKLIGSSTNIDVVRLNDMANLTQLDGSGIRQLEQRIQNSIGNIDYTHTDEYLEKHYKQYQPRDRDLLDRSFTYGMPPDHIVQIPLQSLEKPENKGALNAGHMLERAKQVAVSDEVFTLGGTNCAKVAGWVLYAGVGRNNEKEIFRREALNRYATPQMIFNNAIDYLARVSEKAKKARQRELAFQIEHEPLVDEIQKESAIILGLEEISFAGMKPSLSPKEKCVALLKRFEDTIKSSDKIPYLSNDVKGYIEATSKDDADLQSRFFKLCEAAIIKANQYSEKIYRSNLANDQLLQTDPEWETVKGLMTTDPNIKLSKKNHPELHYSYIILAVDGVEAPYRVAKELGKGMEGKVKLLENEQGKRFAVKILEDNSPLDAKIALMEEADAAKFNFTRSGRTDSAGKALKNKHYIILPYYDLEIADFVEKETLSPIKILILAEYCAGAIKRLHDLNIIHRDIKGSNMMATIDKETNEVDDVYLVDFGAAKKLDDDDDSENDSENEGKILCPAGGGSPLYMAPELGREKIIRTLQTLQNQGDIVEQYEKLIIEATQRLELLLQTKTSELEKPVQPDTTELDKMESLNQEIKDCNKTIEEYKRMVAYAKYQIGELEREKHDLLYQQEVTHSFASDIYSLGIMFKVEFGLNLPCLNLDNMLSKDPDERPTADQIIDILDQALTYIESYGMDAYTSLSTPTIPLPTMPLPRRVSSESLHPAGAGDFCLFSTEDVEKIFERFALYHKNQDAPIFQFKGRWVFQTKNGERFAMSDPIQLDPPVSTYLAQNLRDYSWAVAKVVQGPPQEIDEKLPLFNNEIKVLEELRQLKGTMIDIDNGNDTETHIHLQPYVYGKTYADIIQAAKINKKSIALQDAIMMAFKALKSLTDLHENHGYLHRNINSQNMMWDPEYQRCTLMGFDYAAKGQDDDLTVTEFNESTGEEDVYTTKTDTYQLGSVFAALLSCVEPSQDEAYLQFQQLQAALVNDNYDARPNAREALNAMEKILGLLRSPSIGPISQEEELNQEGLDIETIEQEEPDIEIIEQEEPDVEIIEQDESDIEIIENKIEEKQKGPWMQRFEDVQYRDDHGQTLSGDAAIKAVLHSRQSQLDPNPYLLIREKNTWSRQPEWYLYHLNDQHDLVARPVDHDPSLQELKNILQGHRFAEADKKLKYSVQVEIDTYFYDKNRLVQDAQDEILKKPKAIRKIHSSPWDHNRDFKRQAEYIWNTYIEGAIKEGKKVALLCPSNEEDAEKIYAGYHSFDSSLLSTSFASGSDQAKLFKEILLLIQRKNCRDQVHLLPIPSSLVEDGDRDDFSNSVSIDHLNRALSNVTSHKGAGFTLLSLVDLDNEYALDDAQSSVWERNTDTIQVAKFKQVNQPRYVQIERQKNDRYDNNVVSVVSQKKYVMQQLGSISDADENFDYQLWQSAYDSGKEYPERLSLFKAALTADLIQHVWSANDKDHPVIRKMHNAVKAYEYDLGAYEHNHKNREIFWKELVKQCKNQLASSWTRNSSDMVLLLRAITQFDTNVKQWPEIASVDELIIAQQKRDIIRNVFVKDMERLMKIAHEQSSLDPGIKLKLKTYRYLIKEIEKSDSKIPLSILLSENSPMMTQKRDSLVYKEEPLSIGEVLSLNRGWGLTETTTERILNEVRDQLIMSNPKLIWQKVQPSASRPQHDRPSTQHEELKQCSYDALVRAKENYVTHKSSMSVKNHVNDFNRLIKEINLLLHKKSYMDIEAQVNDIINVVQEAFLKEARQHASINQFVEKLYTSDGYQYPRSLMKQLKTLYTMYPKYPYQLEPVAQSFAPVFNKSNHAEQPAVAGNKLYDDLTQPVAIKEAIKNIKAEYDQDADDMNHDRFNKGDAYAERITCFEVIYTAILQMSGKKISGDPLLRSMERVREVNLMSMSSTRIDLALYKLVLDKAGKNPNSLAAIVLSCVESYLCGEMDDNALRGIMYNQGYKRKGLFSFASPPAPTDIVDHALTRLSKEVKQGNLHLKTR